MNYRTGNFNLFGTYSIRDSESNGGGETYKEVYTSDPQTVSFESRDFIRSGLSHTLRGGFGFSFDDNTILTFAGTYRTRDNNNATIIKYQDYFVPASDPIVRESLLGADIIRRVEDESEEDVTHEYAVNFDKTFGKGHTLKSSLTYRSQDEGEFSDLNEQ